MASPRVSFVVLKNDAGELCLHHCLTGPDNTNSHGQICNRHKIPEDKVFKVEIQPEDLANETNTEPVPWRIDKLPERYRYVQDIGEEWLQTIERLCCNFMTPANITAYLTSNNDALQLSAALFKEEYHERFIAAFNKVTRPNEECASSGISTLTDAILCIQADLHGTAPTLLTSAPVDVPPFTLADLRNPAVWKELPE